MSVGSAVAFLLRAESVGAVSNGVVRWGIMVLWIFLSAFGGFCRCSSRS